MKVLKLEKNDILKFVNEHKDYEIKFDYYNSEYEVEYNLCSYKVNVVVSISDSDENFATDESLYVDYVYLDDGMKAWQVQINSKYLKQEGVDKLKELLPTFFLGESIFPDGNLVKPLHQNCNFAKTIQ